MRKAKMGGGSLIRQLSAVALAFGAVAPMAGCSSEHESPQASQGSDAMAQHEATTQSDNPGAAGHHRRPSNPCAAGARRRAGPCAGY